MILVQLIDYLRDRLKYVNRVCYVVLAGVDWNATEGADRGAIELGCGCGGSGLTDSRGNLILLNRTLVSALGRCPSCQRADCDACCELRLHGVVLDA